MILAQLLFWHKNYVMGLKVDESADTLRNNKTLCSTTAYFVWLHKKGFRGPHSLLKNPRHHLLSNIKAILFDAIGFAILTLVLKFEMNDADARILKGLRAYWQ